MKNPGELINGYLIDFAGCESPMLFIVYFIISSQANENCESLIIV